MKYKLLKDICNISKGEQVNKENLLSSGKYAFFNGGINPSGYYNDSNTKGNTISISEGGNSCGFVNLQKNDYWCGAHCYRITNITVNVKFLYYYLKSKQKEIMQLRTGACMPNIKKSLVEEIKIPDISLSEQEKIVEELDLISSVISENEKRLELYDELVKSKFNEIKAITTEKKSLNKVCVKIFAGGDVDMSDKSDKKDSIHQYPIYTNGEKNEGLYGYTSIKKVEKQAVTISARGTIGYAKVRLETFYPAIRLIVAIPDKSILNCYWLENAITDLNLSGQGTGVKQLTVPMIKEEIIPIPKINIQNEFENFVININLLKTETQNKIKNYQELLDSKMNEYFNK